MRIVRSSLLAAAALAIAVTTFLFANSAGAGEEGAAARPAEKNDAHFEMSALLAERASSGKPYLEFLRVPALSAGVYHLPKGGKDGQSPHPEDEVYSVIAGRARFTSGAAGAETTIDAKAGSVIYVKRGVPHRFHDIEEDLSVLVVFASAGSAAGGEKK